MNRRVIRGTLGISIVLVATLAWWIVRLRHQNTELTSRLNQLIEPPSAEPPGGQLQLRREVQRLVRLRASLGEVTRGESAGLDARIQRLREEISKLEAELAQALPDGRAFAAVNEEYRRQQLHAQGYRQADVLARRRELDERAAELSPAQPGQKDELERLRTERGELDDELERIGGTTRPRTANEEVAQMHAERAEVERRVADLRADLMYWSDQKSGAGPAGRQVRAQTLERQIQEQEAAVRALERREVRRPGPRFAPDRPDEPAERRAVD